MKREIVKIDREKCNGCGLCIPNCHEGALRIVDGKATLLSDLLCDGLGACVGHCPVGALTIEEREAEPYDEITVIKDMVSAGRNVVVAHILHLLEHNEIEYARQGVGYLKDNRDKLPFNLDDVIAEIHEKSPLKQQEQKAATPQQPAMACGCPGSAARSFKPVTVAASSTAEHQSELTHWPVQLHLINPMAAHFKGANLLLAADCVAYALAGFHANFLKGKTLAIACPKLDNGKEIYIEKITALIDNAEVDTITIMKMEVPCCHGLVQLAQIAKQQAQRNIPLKVITVSVQGEIVDSKWM